MFRKRQGAALFNRAAAAKKKCESEKRQVIQKVGSHRNICFNMNTDARYLAKLIQKVGLEWQAKHCKPTMKVCSPNVPDLAYHELRGKGRAGPGEIVKKKFQFFGDIEMCS